MRRLLNTIKYTGGGGGWQPGANTLLYLPLNSTDTYLDKSGNNVSTTNNGVTFGTYQGVDCGYFNSTHIQITPFTYPTDITVLCRCYCYSTDGDGKIIDARDGTHVFITYFERSPSGVALNMSDVIKISGDYKNRWVFCVFSSTSSSQYVRILGDNLDLNSTGNYSFSSFTPTYVNVGQEWNNGASRYFRGGMSELIVESKARTVQEIEDYYNQTKDKYLTANTLSSFTSNIITPDTPNNGSGSVLSI